MNEMSHQYTVGTTVFAAARAVVMPSNDMLRNTWQAAISSSSMFQRL